MTDKELTKFSKLELLELLLVESRENERLRAELEQLKQENTIKKSVQQLNETVENLGKTSEKFDDALKQISLVLSSLNNQKNETSDEFEMCIQTETVNEVIVEDKT